MEEWNSPEVQDFPMPKQNSHEIGKAGNRFKIYYDTTADLVRQLEELKEVGLLDEKEVAE